MRQIAWSIWNFTRQEVIPNRELFCSELSLLSARSSGTVLTVMHSMGLSKRCQIWLAESFMQSSSKGSFSLLRWLIVVRRETRLRKYSMTSSSVALPTLLWKWVWKELMKSLMHLRCLTYSKESETRMWDSSIWTLSCADPKICSLLTSLFLPLVSDLQLQWVKTLLMKMISPLSLPRYSKSTQTLGLQCRMGNPQISWLMTGCF